MTSTRKSELQTAEGKLLELAMRRRRLKAPAVASGIGVGVETVRNWIKGYRSEGKGKFVAVHPDPIDLAKAAQFLGISQRDLDANGLTGAAEELAALANVELTGEFDSDSTPFRRLVGLRSELDAIIEQLRGAVTE